MRRHVMCLITVLLLAPSTASAFTSQVTSVTADGQSRFVADAASPPTVHVVGTADSGPIALYCVSSQANSLTVNPILIKDNVTVTGTDFATDATWPVTNNGICEVYAVPSGSPPSGNSDLNGMTGLKVYWAYKESVIDGGKVYDYFVQPESNGAENGFDSFGDCMVDFNYLVSLNLHEYGAPVWDCNGYVEGADRAAPSNVPSILVDNHPAYPTYYIGSNDILRPLPGWTSLSYDVTDDAGTWHVTSNEGIWRCANTDDFPPHATCTGFASSGVGLHADERTSPDGRTITQELRFASEDNQPHTLSLVLNQTLDGDHEYLFPGTATFQGYSGSESPASIAAAAATIRTRVDSSPPSITEPLGAITYAVTPSSEQFWFANRYFVQRYTSLSIPAGHAVRLVFIYNVALTTDALDGEAAAAEASFGAPPAITVTSLPNATGAAYTLTGTVNAPEGLNSITVNDAPVAVAGDGSFSVPETLAAGANAFTVNATDELSRTTTTPFSVTLSTAGPPASNTVAAVVFGKSGKPKLKGRVLTTGYTASCPGTGPNCSITAAATGGRKKAGSGKATVNAGAKAKLKVKLTKAAVKQLKRRHKLKLSLKLTGKRTGAATTTTKKALTLKKKR